VIGTDLFTILPNVYFSGAGGFTNGTFQMSLLGPVGSNYVLQVSTNLLQWSALSTTTTTNSSFILTDSNTPSATARFYRVLQEP
jgi:hypothetical protein